MQNDNVFHFRKCHVNIQVTSDLILLIYFCYSNFDAIPIRRKDCLERTLCSKLLAISRTFRDNNFRSLWLFTILLSAAGCLFFGFEKKKKISHTNSTDQLKLSSYLQSFYICTTCTDQFAQFCRVMNLSKILYGNICVLWELAKIFH